jgi:hypothetical protein
LRTVDSLAFCLPCSIALIELTDFSLEDDGRNYLVAVEQDQEEAIRVAWELDEEKGLTWFDNLHRVEPVSDELAAEADEPLSRGEAVLVNSL